MGSVVQDISVGFDKFWNSELAVPIEAFRARIDPQELDVWRENIRKVLESQRRGLYAKALDSRLLADLRSGAIQPVAGEVTLYTDTPEKILSPLNASEQAILAVELVRRLRAASEKVIIVTPYFVPQDKGADLFEELLARGVKIQIVTNSLASTNHVPVHAGYTRYRKRLLQAGAEIYEIRADSPSPENDWGHAPEKRTLHSKATVIDNGSIFVGSLNFDPRSVYINTEMGIFIDSAEIGEPFTQRLVEELGRVTWRVELDGKGSLRWIYDVDGEYLVSSKEPGTSWWRRFQAGFYKLLPIENQL